MNDRSAYNEYILPGLKNDYSTEGLLEQLFEYTTVSEYNRMWPEPRKRALLNAHHTHKERFEVWHFLWANGIMPEHATVLTLWSNSARYDAEAWRSAREWERNAYTSPEYFRRYRTYVINTDYYEGSNLPKGRVQHG